MVIGITGATGFIGKNLILEFIELNKKFKDSNPDKEFPYKIILLLRKDSNVKNIKDLIIHCKEIQTRDVDYFNIENLKEKIKDLNFIIHLAGVTKSKKSRDYYKYNFELTSNLVNAICELNKSERENINKIYNQISKDGTVVENILEDNKIKFIFSSSQSACGPSYKNKLITPQDQEKPVSNYGKSKLKAEKYIKEKLKNYIILRFPSVLGPYDMDGLNLFKMALSPLIFQVGKEYKLEVIYSKEVVNILKFFILNFDKFNGKTFHIGYENFLNFNIFVKKVRELAKKDNLYFIFSVPKILAFLFALVIRIIDFFRKKPSIVNYEKIIEIIKGNWLFDKSDFFNTNYKFIYNIDSMIEETFKWYNEKKFLKY